MYNIELERVKASENNSFACRQYQGRLFEHNLHIHQEIEIVYIDRGVGRCIVGDSHTPYAQGDLFVFAGYLPHHFKSDIHSKQSNSIYLQFSEDTLPSNYTTMPGCVNIKQLIQSCSRGVKYSLTCEDQLVGLLQEMLSITGFARLSLLYNILDNLGHRLDLSQLITSPSYTITQHTNDSVYHLIVEYINQHYKEHIALIDLAEYVHMNGSALCRYFKSKAGESIFNYIIDVRVAIAKEELASTDTPIIQIAYDVGFNSISNFNTQFKKRTKLTPSQYREKVR